MGSGQSLNRHFGQRLRLARRAAALSQAALAQRLQVGQDTISHYEQGKFTPNLLTLCRLAQILERDVRYFLPDEFAPNCPEEEREVLALLSRVSPLARQYILLLLRSWAKAQQRRRFFTEEVWQVSDPQVGLLRYLERDLLSLDRQPVRYKAAPPLSPLHSLVGFTTVLLMGMDLEKVDGSSADFVRRLANHGQGLVTWVRDLMLGASPRRQDESVGVK